MKSIKVGMQVKYIGRTNDYTFEKDIYQNSIGTVRNVFEINSVTSYQVEFENGVLASIDSNHLEKLLSLNELKEWCMDLKPVLFDINVTTKNLYILKHENSNNFRNQHSEVYLNLWYQQYFICIIQLAKLFSNSRNQHRSITKLCKKIKIEDFDNELNQILLLNKTKLNDVLKSKEDLILTVSEITSEMENKSTIINKINYLRDKVFAHTDPDTLEYDISVEKLICLKDFANQIYNDIFGKIFDEYEHFQLTRQYDFRSIIEVFMK